MNLHGIVAGAISTVNPLVPAEVFVSTGPAATAPSGRRTPTFATPGSITGSIAGNVLTVTAQTAGKLLRGQLLSAVGIAPQTTIVQQLSGTPGGLGTYAVSRAQTLASVAMTTSLIVPAQVQSLTFRDLQQIDGLNLQGDKVAIYFYGEIDGIVRPEDKGGDLIVLPAYGVLPVRRYLVSLVLEQWPDWCKVAATLQNGE